MVVRRSVGIVRSVVEVECDIEEVDDLEVSLNCDVQSASFKTSFILKDGFTVRRMSLNQYFS